MKSIIKASVNNPMVVNIIMAVIIVMGLFYTLNTRKEAFPAMTFDIIMISVPFPGASAEEVEEGVTIKIEEAIEGINGIDYVESTSSENISSVSVVLRTDVANPRKTLDDVKNKIDQIYAFPDDAEEPSVVMLENEQEVLSLNLYGDVDQLSLKSVAEDVRDELQTLPDVSKVLIKGLRPREMAVEISEQNMQRYGITFNEIAAAVRNYDLDMSGGTIKTDVEELNIRAVGRNYRPEDLEKVPLRTLPDGTSVLLRDVAHVYEDFEDSNYELLYNGKPGLQLYVMKAETEDTLVIADAVKTYLKQKEKALPPGIKIDLSNDLSKILNQRISLLLKNGRYAIVLVFIMLMIFLGWRLSFWVAVGLPVALMGTMVLLRFWDITINMMSLFSFIMVLGILVDDAIVVAENVQQHIERGDPPIKAAIDGASEVFPAVLASVSTTIFAFMPMLFVQGMYGKFMFPIAMVAVLGLAVSLFESIIILPTHLAHSLRPIEELHTATSLFARMRRGTDRLIQGLINYTYKPILRGVMKYNWAFMALGFALFIFSIGVVKSGKIKFVFFPPIDSEYIYASYTLEPGSSMAVHDRTVAHILDKVQAVDREFTEKRDAFLKTPDGAPYRESADPGTPVIVRHVALKGGGLGRGLNPNQGEVFIELLDGETLGIPNSDVLARWRELIGDVPGVDKLTFESTVGPPGGDSVEIMLNGDDMQELRRAASRTKDKLRDFNGVYEIRDDLEFGKRELRLALNDRGKAAGLTLSSLATQVRQGYYGHEMHRIQRGRDEIKVWVRYPRDERDSLAGFESIKVRTPDGGDMPLLSVADITTERQLRSINRYERKRKLVISCKVDIDRITPNELKDEVNKFMPDVLRQVTGVTFRFEGQDRSQRQMGQSMMIGFMICLVAIFITITLTFRNYAHALLIMTLIPMGFVGAVFGHLIVPLINSRIDRLDMTMLSMGGVVALAGIVVNDSIVMVDAIKRNIGDGMFLREAVFHGAVSRFRPIVLTTITTSIGMMPLILEKSLQAQFLIPMAASIAFGLIVATFFTQVWLPATFICLNSAKRGWYLMAKGKLYSPDEIERNGLPDGGFIKGLIPWWLGAALAAGLIIGIAVFTAAAK